MSRNNGRRPAENQLVKRFAKSANQVWHLGRGAYVRAGSESGRLVGGLLGISGRLDREAKSRVYEARSSATEAWDRLESAFVHRVARALNALQIPTARDVHELNSRVESLQKAVVALERRVAENTPPGSGPAKPARRSKAVARGGAAAGVKASARKTRARTTRAGNKTGS